MRKELSTFIAAVMLLALPSAPVRADAWSGPIGVMRPDGTVVVIRGDAAKQLSREHLTLQCLSCASPRKAAFISARVERGKKRPRAYLIRPLSFRYGWGKASVMYIAESGPVYLKSPSGVGQRLGTEKRVMFWDAWMKVTPAMERIVLNALRTDEGRLSHERDESARAEAALETGKGSVPLGPIIAVLVAAIGFGLGLLHLRRRETA
jgi:hypothetical protein